jgi:hypothetical protein
MYGFLAGADLASAAPASASAQPKHSKPTQLRRLEERIERQMVDRKRCDYEKGRYRLFFSSFFQPFFCRWRGLMHSKGARTPAASTPIGPRARL